MFDSWSFDRLANGFVSLPPLLFLLTTNSVACLALANRLWIVSIGDFTVVLFLVGLVGIPGYLTQKIFFALLPSSERVSALSRSGSDWRCLPVDGPGVEIVCVLLLSVRDSP